MLGPAHEWTPAQLEAAAGALGEQVRIMVSLVRPSDNDYTRACNEEIIRWVRAMAGQAAHYAHSAQRWRETAKQIRKLRRAS